jgi:hypothetical protein
MQFCRLWNDEFLQNLEDTVDFIFGAVPVLGGKGMIFSWYREI